MKPTVYLLCGLPGSGKTTYAKKLEARGITHLSSDYTVYERYGRYGIDYPEDKFRELEEIVRQDLERKLVRQIEEGKSAILDYGLWKKASRDYYKNLIEKHGGQWKLIHFNADPDVLLERVKDRNLQRADYAIPITEEMLKNFIHEFEEPINEGEDLP